MFKLFFHESLAQFGGRVGNVGPSSGLFASTTSGSIGNGGSIVIDPRIITIQDGAKIAVDSQGSGIGGSITINADRLLLRDRASINAETASAKGGEIILTLKDLLLLRYNSSITAKAGNDTAGGDGGTITITIPRGIIVGVPLENSDIKANAFKGKGGSVNITTQRLFGIQDRSKETDFSDITVSSQFNINGTFSLNTLGIDPSQGLQPIPSDLVDTASLIVPSCAPSRDRETSRFVAIGRGGLPPNPHESLSGMGVWQDTRTTAQNAANVKTNPLPAPAHLIEATNWIRRNDGTIKFVTQPAIDDPTNAFLALSQTKGCHAP